MKIVQITDHESPLSSSAPQSAVDAAVQTLVMNSSVVGASMLARRVADKEAFRGEVSGMRFVKYFPGSRAFDLFSSLVEPATFLVSANQKRAGTSKWHSRRRYIRIHRNANCFIHGFVPLWNSSVALHCGTPLWNSFMELLYETPLWNSSVELLYGIPQWRSTTTETQLI